jgi:citrate lyase beta subunit
LRLNSRAVITPRTNAPSLSIFEEDVAAILSEDTHQHIDGICVPKVDTVQDMKLVSEILSEYESKYKLEQNRFKVIPQIESTLSMVNMKEIFGYG